MHPARCGLCLAATALAPAATGNGANGMAMLVDLPASILPPSTQRISRKATVADLNGDGRPDVVVMIEETSNSRPTILRNVPVGGGIAFIDWTPASAFPNGNAHKGWNVIVFDSNGDGDQDIFLGGWSGDHLFENVPPIQVVEPDVNVLLPPFFNGETVAVSGSLATSETDSYSTAESINGYIAAVLNGPDDYLLEVFDSGNNLLGVSDRGGAGIEEALQVNASGPVMISVAMLDCAAVPEDINGDCAIDVVDLLELLASWGPQPREPIGHRR